MRHSMLADNEPNNADGKLYNLDKLKEISRGNNAFVQRMIFLFTDRTPSLLTQIKEAYLAKDFKAVYNAAHLLKPSIDNMHIRSVKQNIRDIEELAVADHSSPLLRENIDKVEKVLLRVCEQLQQEADK